MNNSMQDMKSDIHNTDNGSMLTENNPYISPNLLKLFIEENNLNCQFFTTANYNKLQNDIINEVNKQSNGQYKIGYQNKDELIIVMRSMYLMYSNNQPDDIKQQVEMLNNSVLEYCVPNILNNILQYIGFIKDRESVPFLPNPINDNLYLSLQSNNIN